MNKECDIELCASMGFLNAEQLHRLHEAGVTSYHHNIETSRPDDTTQPEDDTTAAGPLTLSHEDVSLSGDESFTLSVRSGSGTATYTSKDPSIASVSASGVVTGLKKGTTEITVQRGSARAVCIG